MAKPQSIDDLFPIGAGPEAGPSPAEIEAASKPAFYPRAQTTEQAATAPSLDTMFPTGGPPEPTGGDIAGTIAKGAVAGALRDAPVVAGAMSGFKLGMPLAAKAAPVMGPFAVRVIVAAAASCVAD
jgi:hypothetical protein